MDATRLLLPLVVLAAAPTPAGARELRVCPTCELATVQSAVRAAAPGDLIQIGAGVYAEDLVLDKAGLRLEGAGQDLTVIVPATSAPAPCADTSLCGGAATSVILIRADGIALSHLSVDGDNPALTSGITRGGVDIDARNGILTDNLAGGFGGLAVHDVTVRNVYLRGIYSYGGDFEISAVTVENVRGDGASIGLFSFGGSGSFIGNTVVGANDAISANHSSGILFLDNVIRGSGSGIHTDNAGGGGGLADLIAGNRVEDCAPGGYGIFVFVPSLAPTVEGNEISGCALGLGAFGGGGAEPTWFTDNRVVGAYEADGVGALLTTDQLGYGCGDNAVALSGNTFAGHETGVLLEQPGCALEASVTANNLHHNQAGLVNTTPTAVDATRNWWGCARGPSALRCDDVQDLGGGATQVEPFSRTPVR